MPGMLYVLICMMLARPASQRLNLVLVCSQAGVLPRKPVRSRQPQAADTMPRSKERPRRGIDMGHHYSFLGGVITVGEHGSTGPGGLVVRDCQQDVAGRAVNC